MHAPGSDGIAGELKVLQQRIEELERRPAPAPETALVRLGAVVNTAGGSDSLISGAWDTLATVDTASAIFRRAGTVYQMEKEPEYWNGTAYTAVANSHFRIPKPGRWQIELNCIFNGPAPANTVGTGGCHLRLNNISGPLLAQDARWVSTYAGFTPCHAVCSDRTFVAGDKIYFKAFSGSAQQVVPSKDGAYSYAFIRYLGPN